MQKVGVLGGTFNPIHRGHLLMAKAALAQVDRVIWVPTRQPFHKPQQELADFLHRAEMVKRAIFPHPNFALAAQPGAKYAIDTLKTLQADDPDRQWYWILGLDAFGSLPRWYHRGELAKLCQWLVAPRAGANLTCEQVAAQMQAQSLPICWHLLSMPPLSVSSSQVRQRCRDRQSIANLVPLEVQTYIETHQLYSS